MKAKTRKPQKPRPGYSLAEHNPELMSEYHEIFYDEPRKSIHPQNLIDKIISLI